ncbi:hypothetical protein AcW1_003415 [Taiwanofungus camphoratus]|nr:hypothetical protein AcW1_003415 [Antrodia cinnamomea]
MLYKVPRSVPHVRPYAFVRRYAAVGTTTGTVSTRAEGLPAGLRKMKEEGTIMDVFGGLSGEALPLPPRFAALKKEICKDPEGMVQSWRGILKELEDAVEEVARKGADMIPKVSFADVTKGLSSKQEKDIKSTGVVIIKGGVSREEALAWKQSIRNYIRANEDKVKGGPPDNIVFYEIYNSSAQIAARTHPALIATQRALLSLWHASRSAPPASAALSASLRTPISYFDRLRIRPPGPSTFTLGPHIDSGGVERWEDPGFRACFARILEGGERWRAHDPFDVSPRLSAKQDLYDGPNQCSIFRPWQGWTALSDTGPGEGTLRVLPMLSLSTAYIMLRPFFRPRPGLRTPSLRAEDWELDLDGTLFPGSVPRKAQELNAATHPHLVLNQTLISIPRVEPGDQVYWHCDVVHAVESEHTGPGDSSVLYIPAVPLTEYNANYLRDQVAAFKSGLPSPDFPGGEGESTFAGRCTADDVQTTEGRRLLGLEPFEIPSDADEGEANLIRMANSFLI